MPAASTYLRHMEGCDAVKLVPDRSEFDGTLENAKQHLSTLRSMYLIARTEGPDIDPGLWEDWRECFNALVRQVNRGEVPDPDEIIALYEDLVEWTL